MATSEELERRAVAWERCGRAIASIELDLVLRAAGPDTWIGPTADELDRLVRVTRAELRAVAADAARQAARWHQEARAARARELAAVQPG